ncbi:hypothetical protein [Streptomyces sp. NPDC060198]|uniref:hypothetical protein n=1 Tax=Streptomyces sp. NPDC060198 TaxID=3347070 RepID=UPI00365C8619
MTYEDHAEYADYDPPTAEEERTAVLLLDAADEERHAAEERAAAAAAPEDDDECAAEFIDGSWTYCGCPQCEEQEDRDAEDRAEVDYWDGRY